jgi:para-nitrobenzyl esterase
MMRPEMGNATAGLAGGVVREKDAKAPSIPAATGAVHSSEIEYAMGNLPTNRVYDWQPEDFKVSAIIQEYFANFIKTGNPNGSGVPFWSAANSGKTEKVMHIDLNTREEDDNSRERYKWLNQFYNPNIP